MKKDEKILETNEIADIVRKKEELVKNKKTVLK